MGLPLRVWLLKAGYFTRLFDTNLVISNMLTCFLPPNTACKASSALMLVRTFLSWSPFFLMSVSGPGVFAQQNITYGADTPVAISGSSAWQKPVWLTDLSLGVKESYDDNVLLVSGDNLSPQASWVTTVSPKIGFNFAPLLGNQNTLQTLSMSYAPNVNIYHEDPSQNYTAHKIGDTIKGQAGNVSYLLDNAFLYNDGNHQAPTYGQPNGSDSLDQYRNNYAQAVARERLAQTQDRATIRLQYDCDKFFVRSVASLLD